jgi:hypothetical protein
LEFSPIVVLLTELLPSLAGVIGMAYGSLLYRNSGSLPSTIRFPSLRR